MEIKGGPRVHYTRSGNPSGSLLICLHGLGGSVATFLPLLPHLPGDRYDIICVDFGGFGQTDLSSTSLSIQSYVENLQYFISHIRESCPLQSAGRDDPLVIIGHSLGSIVALHYAAKSPSSIAGLGLLAVGRSAYHIQIAKQRMRGLAEKVKREGIEHAAELAMTTNFAPGEEDGDGRREFVHGEVVASDPKAYAMVCEAMVSAEHHDPDYASILCPVVFVSGRGDVISPPGKVREMSSLMGGKTIVEIVRGGHQPILSDLEGTKEAMAELFRLVEESTREPSLNFETTAGASRQGDYHGN